MPPPTTSYPLDRIKVVLLEGVHARGRELLEGAGFAVEAHKEALAGDELLEAAGDAHLLGIRSKTHITAEFFERARRLWSVGCFCIGTNQVDLAAAAARGVAVFNAPFSNTRSVAEMTLAEIIVLHRGLFDQSMAMHKGQWNKSAAGCHEVRGRSLGIVGYGRIGSQLSVLAESLGMRVMYFDIADRLPLGNARPVRTLAELLAEADVVSLHVPATAQTQGLIGARELAQMRAGSFLINNARGGVVDEVALAAAIRSGHIAGGAVDVFAQEPASNDQPVRSPLVGVPGVILTPHVGGSTLEAQRSIAEEVATKLIRLMNNGSTTTAVNVPEVELPLLHPEQRRILHFHHNVPGVLSKMHNLIASLGVNISAEYLQSNQKHGYVILDIGDGGGDDEAIKQGLKSIPETIRVRTLW